MKIKNVLKIVAVVAGVGAVGYVAYKGIKKLIEKEAIEDYHCDCHGDCEDNCGCDCHKEKCGCPEDCFESEDKVDGLVKEAVNAAAEVNGENGSEVPAETL